MASARKRPRPEAEEPGKADCPFTIRLVDPKDKEQKKKTKRRRRTDDEDSDSGSKLMMQLSPFSPNGTFKTHETMDVHYAVDPEKRWSDLTRYNSFVLNGTKYFSEGFIYVANESTIERQKAVARKESLRPRTKSEDDWVARILEIRASDEHHVYARVYWMYWPDELPPGTRDGRKLVQGRQPYHGANELLASNHMDIINVVSVTSHATVNQWYEENDEEIQNALYWRQAFDVRTHELSSVDALCKCGQPENPDRTLIGCTSEPCRKWLHEDCIRHEALLATFERLGRNKPHVADGATIKEEKEEKEEKEGKEENEAKRPLSPVETGAAVSAQASIDVKQDADVDPDAMQVDTEDNVEVKQPDDEDALTPPEAKVEQSASPAAESSDRGSLKPSIGRKPGRPRKKPLESNGEVASERPYDGLFEVKMRMDLNPSMLEFTDLRENVVGGEKTWQEPIKCLLCKAQID